jgi:DNA helicase-2/ATP-dependent DNA helicase PcrA
MDWPDAKVVRLEDNYRSTNAILTMANLLIAFNKSRHDKVLRAARPGGEKPRIHQAQDEEAEAKFVVEDIRSRLGEPGTEPRDFAILFRTNEQPRAFEMELRKAKLPYVLIGGMSFYDRKEVRDILAYCKLLALPSDEVALLRIINTPPRGIGQASVTALLENAIKQGAPLWKTLADAHKHAAVTPTAASSIEKFCRMIDRYRQRLENEPLLAVINDLITEIKYQDELARLYKDPQEVQARWAAVEEVINAIAGFEKRSRKGSLSAFLDEIATGERDDSDDKESQLARNAIALMTLHSAKGLEFPQVYLVGMEEGILPHHRSVAVEGEAIDEERRLCYVGITRAQDRLTISLALSRMKWGKPRESIPSRFLFEVTGQAEKGEAIRRAAVAKSKQAKTIGGANRR